MKEDVFILDGVLEQALMRAQRQLDSSETYSRALVLQDLVRDPLQSRECEDYMGDLSGRYLGAIRALHEQQLEYDTQKALEILSSVLDEQNPDGSFGPVLPAFHTDHGQAWGHGRLLDGLLDARSWAPAEMQGALADAIESLADYATAQAKKWTRWITQNGHVKFVLDPVSYARPLLRLHAEVGARRYLDAASQLVSVLPTGREGLHSHGRLLALRAKLAEIQIRRGDLSGLEAEIENLRSVIVLENGSILESVSTKRDINTEACATADWIMLNLEMFEATGDFSFFEHAQFSLFNGLLHAQSANGHFGCETLYIDGEILTVDYAPEAWWCCTFHGIEAIGSFARTVFTSDGKNSYRLLAPISGRSNRYGVRVVGHYPAMGNIVVQNSHELEVSVPSNGILTNRNTGLAFTENCILSAGESEFLFEPQLHLVSQGSMLVPPFSNSTVTGLNEVRGKVSVRLGGLALALGSNSCDAADVLRARSIRFDSIHLNGFEAKVMVSGYNRFAQEMLFFPIGDRRLDQDALVRISFDLVELS